jgi:hypothetical protein
MSLPAVGHTYSLVEKVICCGESLSAVIFVPVVRVVRSN